MSIRIKFKPPDFSELIDTANRKAEEIDDIAREAIVEGVKPMQEAMIQGAERHKRTGKVVNALKANPLTPKKDGNYISVTLGITEEQGKDGSWHAVFQEFGSPKFPADPFIRPAVEKNRAKYKKIALEVFQKRGIPLK